MQSGANGVIMSDITLNKKTDATINFQYYESDEETPRTLVGATLFFTLKENAYDSDADDSEAILKKTVTNHSNAAAGQSQINLTDDETDVDPKTYFYDIKIKEVSGNIYLASSGRCLVSATVTNRTI